LNIYEVVEAVHERTGADRGEILDRARGNWPGTVEFRLVQVRLLTQALLASQAPRGPAQPYNIALLRTRAVYADGSRGQPQVRVLTGEQAKSHQETINLLDRANGSAAEWIKRHPADSSENSI
jgi:hypothetical protein